MHKGDYSWELGAILFDFKFSAIFIIIWYSSDKEGESGL